jgi:acetyl-CoA decarbonylase/synthase complex subunit gamma
MVSANYKMSFDTLRSALGGRDAWILVLDTDGINVWCAAGKGTFGTDELVRRVQEAGLQRVVSHRKLVVPQLGAPGVSAHEVRQRCGFHVVYGPVRASDLPAFLDARMRATPQMRRVRFGLRDRLVLAPVELVMGGKAALLLAALFLLLGGLGPHGYSLAGVRTAGMAGATLVLGAFVGGAVLGPALLPWLPGRAFSVKGAALGLVVVAALAALGLPEAALGGSWQRVAAWALMVPALTSFVVMNFTGASTFTSLSGVLREVRASVPVQIAGAVIGLGLWVWGLVLGGGTAT